MYETFNILAKSASYSVKIGADFITAGNQFADNEQPVLIDMQVAKFWPQITSESDIEIEAIEELKTLETVGGLVEQLRLRGANRGSCIYAVGGGIVQDLSTFVSSVYMRGVDWIYCPTTLLGMVDSCVGGKSSLNVGRFKNIAGNFYPPKEIWIDVSFCKTLSPVDKIAGMCEAAKICFSNEGSAFHEFLELARNADHEFSEKFLMQTINLSLNAKKHFIEQDEFDHGIRLLLNFGHTFGHAIEAATKFSITHGVAVGLGMLAEAKLASLLCGWQTSPSRLAQLESYIKNLLAKVPNLNNFLANLSLHDAMQAFKSDKKHAEFTYSVILPNQDGYLSRVSIPISMNTDEILLNIFCNFKQGIRF